MSLLAILGFKKKAKEEEKNVAKGKEGDEEEHSPINSMLHESHRKYLDSDYKDDDEIDRELKATFPGFGADADTMTPQQYNEAMDRLLGKNPNKAFYDLSKIDKTVFPPNFSSIPALGGEGVAMDAMGMHGPGVQNVPIGSVKGLPRGIPNGSHRIPNPCGVANQAQYAGNVAIEGSGLGMMPDPMRFPINERVLKHFQSRVWITYSGCALISTHEWVSRACLIPAEEAMAHGYKVICSSREHGYTDTHESNEARFHYDIKIAADRMGISKDCIKLNYYKKVFGVAVAVPRVEFKKDAMSPTREGQPYSYEDEYDPNMIKPGSYRGFSVLEPIWYTYQFDEESKSDPISPHFYEPTWIMTYGRKIHRSWYIRVINVEVPDILKPAYYFGGLSHTQMMYERVFCADQIANEIPLLVKTKRMLVADGNLEQLIEMPKKANRFFNAVNYFRDNFSVFVKRPSHNVTQLDTNLGELPNVCSQHLQMIAAIAQIPVTKLFKNVPTGLQSTGEYEWDDYAQSLMAIQDNDYTPLLRRHYELYCASNYPDRKDIHLDVEWNPIDIPKQEEIIQMTSQSAQAVSTLMGINLVTIEEGRNMLKGTNLSSYQHLNAEVPPLLKKLEELKDPEKAQALQMKQQMAQQQMQMQMQMQMQASMQGGMPGGGAPGMGGTAPGAAVAQGGQAGQESEADKATKDAFKRAVEEARKVLGIKEGGEGQGEEIQEKVAEEGAQGGESASEEKKDEEQPPEQK